MVAMRTFGTFLLALAVSACGGSSSGPGDGDPPPPPPPPPPPANFVVTFVSRSIDPDADAGQLYAYVGDAAISRAQMQTYLNENAPTVRYAPGSALETATLTVPSGKMVTIFAVEFGTNGFTTTGQPVTTRAPRNATEFVSFTGALATPEPGVAVIVADAAKTVTANFDRMEGLPITIRGCNDYKIQTTGPGALTFGPTVPDPAPDLISTNAFTNLGRIPATDSLVGFVWGKQGTMITFRARTRENRALPGGGSNAGFMQWNGVAAQCGSNLICQLPVPVRGNTPGPLQQQNSWTERSGVRGCGCLAGETNCQILP